LEDGFNVKNIMKIIFGPGFLKKKNHCLLLVGAILSKFEIGAFCTKNAPRMKVI